MTDSTATLAALIAQTLDGALAGHMAAAVAAAREEEFRKGFVEGQRDARRAMDARLRALLAEDGPDDSRGGAGDGGPPGTAEGGRHVDDRDDPSDGRRAGAGVPAEGEPLPHPVAGQGPSPQVLPSPGAAVGPAATKASATLRWRTPARAALLRQAWPAGIGVGQIAAEMAKLPGGPVRRNGISVWASELQVRRSPEARTPRIETMLAAKAAKRASEGAPDDGPVPAADGITSTAGGEPPASPDPPTDAPTPQFVRARELLGMGLSLHDVRQTVRLSPAEYAEIQDEARGHGVRRRWSGPRSGWRS